MFMDADYFSISGEADPQIDFPAFLDWLDLNLKEMHVELLQNRERARHQLRFLLDHQGKT